MDKEGTTRPSQEMDEAEAVMSKLAYHPLLNEDILHLVLQEQSFERLKELRQVHSAWDLAASRLLTPKCTTIDFRNHRIADMEELTKLLCTSNNFPCKSFSVTCDNAVQETLANFFRVVAPWVTHLGITRLDKSDALFGILYGDDLLDITYLELKSVAVEISSPGKKRPQYRANLASVCVILENAPKLEEVRVDATRSNVITSTEFLRMMDGVRRFKVTHLTLWANLSDKHLRLYMSRATTVQLNEIVLTFVDSPIRVTLEVLKGFLESQSATLATLRVDWQLEGESFTLDLPPLPELTTLKLDGLSADHDHFDETAPCLYLDNVSYVKKLPKLESLTLNGRGAHNIWRFVRNDLPPVKTVEELQLNGIHEDEIPMSFVARMFPRVKKLAVPNVHNALLSLFESGMSGVEELTLLMYKYNSSADESLLGVERVDAKGVSHLNPNGPWFRMIENSFQPPEFLNQLKVLKMEVCRGAFDGPYLSDRGCRLVLLKLRNLRCLHLSCSRDSGLLDISNEVLAQMERKFTVSFGNW